LITPSKELYENYASFTRESIQKAHMKHTYTIYTAIKSALRVHDVCSKFALCLLHVLYALCICSKLAGETT